jgi:hypothetical protein
MKTRYYLILILLMPLYVGLIPADSKASLTIATFADPSKSSSDPLFTVDFVQMKFTGGWPDSKTGLLLEIPYQSISFQNAWFDMTEVTILSPAGDTGSGQIRFFQDGDSVNPLVVIDFDSGLVSRYSFGADEFFVADNVTITGPIIPETLSEEQLAFSFSNLAKLPGHTNWSDGFTATASFTSSALPVPEPATICLLGLGALSLLSRKR